VKKILSFLWQQSKYFIINPFWTSWICLTIIGLSAILNGLIWYLYLTKFHIIVNLTPIGYSSAVIILNLILANIVFQKQSLISYILLVVALLIQVFMIFFLKIAVFAGAF